MKDTQGQRASNFQGEEMESMRKVCNGVEESPLAPQKTLISQEGRQMTM